MKPLRMMRSYLERMDAVSPAVEPGAARPVRLLAALGPKMIELSGNAVDGATRTCNYRNSWLRQGFDESDFAPGALTSWFTLWSAWVLLRICANSRQH